MDIGWIDLILFVVLVAITEISFLTGYRRFKKDKRVGSTQTSTLSAMQTLLALLMAFTVSMATVRFETRRFNLATETNAIGTAYRRAALLKEPHRGQIRGKLRAYVDNRIEFYRLPYDAPDLERLNREALALQGESWEYVSELAQKDPNPVTVGPLLSALNDMVTLQEKPSSAFENHVPDSIIFLIMTAAFILMGYLGYLNGLSGIRHFEGTLVLAVMFTLTVTVILDLDRPRRGSINVGYEGLMRLRDRFSR